MNTRRSLLLAFILTASQCVGCAFLKPVARTALDAIEVLCALEARSNDVEEIAQACRISDELVPALRNLLAARIANARRTSCEH
jgi:hypothetical protein